MGDLEILRDVDGQLTRNRINIDTFKTKIEHHNLWRAFEVKACFFKSDINEPWKVQFIHVELSNAELEPRFSIRVNTDHVRLIHQISHVNQLNNLLNEVAEGNDVILNNSNASLRLLTHKIEYGFYQSTQSFVHDFGLDSPCYALLRSGNM